MLNSSSNSTSEDESIPQDLIPHNVLEMFIFIDFIVVYTTVCVVGIAMNICNIVVFSRLGLDDTVNVTLLVLSVSDLCFLVCTLMVSICYYPFWKLQDFGFSIDELKLFTVGWPGFFFRRVSNWVTAYLTFERCLCVAEPLKVKQIITPRRTVLILTGIFALMVLTVLPAYLSFAYVPIWNEAKNRTNIVLVFHENRVLMDAITTGISFCLTVSTFIWVTVCTLILVVSLRQKTRWRLTMEVTVKSDNVSLREKKVVKMVTLLSVIFIIAFTPDVCLLLAMTFEPRLNFFGQYNNLFYILAGVSETLLVAAASCNTFIYLNMSSKFRESFARFFF